MKNYFLLIVFINIFLFSICSKGFTQIIAPETLAPTDVWNQTINNAKAVKVYMIGTIKNDGGKVLVELKSESFYLKQGIIQLSNTFIKTSKTDWQDQDAKQAVVATGNFPKGNYTLCTRLIEHANDRELANPCRNATVGDLIKRQGDKSKYKNISAYGSASVDFMYNNPKPVFTELPNSYLRIEAEQGLSVYSFPIAGQFRYTTEKTNYKKDVDMFTLAFDRSRFERNVKELILRKVIEAQLKKVKLNEDDLRTLTEYEDLESKIKSVALQKVDQEIQKISSELKSLAQEKVTDATSKQKAALQKKYNQLLEQKRKTDKLKNRYMQLKATYDKWITSGRLEELKKMAYEPPQFDDPKQMLSLLKQYGAYTGMNKFLFNIKELSIGTAFPSYSPLTLNGTQIFGANFEWNPGLFYIAASAGKIHSPITFATDSLAAQFTQKMIGMRLGFGKIDGTHVSFNALRFFDVDSSITTSQFQEFYPQNSWVGSIDFNIGFSKNRVVEVGGEVAGLMQNHNTYDTLQAYYLNNTQSKLTNQLEPNLSSSADYAYTGFVKLNLFNNRSRFIIENQYTGPGYKHPGVFGLSNDLIRYSTRWDQRLGKTQSKVSAFYNRDFDNISDSKSYQTDRNEFGVEAQINSKSIPNIQIRLSLDRLKSNFNYFNSGIINLGLNKSFKLAKHSMSSTQLQCMYLHTTTDSVAHNINTIYAFIQQNVSFKYGISIHLTAQLSNNAVANLTSRNTGYQLLLGKTLAKKIRLLVGSGFNTQNTNHKLAYTISLDGVVFKNFQLNVRAFKNKYSEYPGVNGKYNETYAQAGIRYSW